MRIFVTGGTGFIGSHLIDSLIEKNHEVVALLRKSSNVQYLQGHEVELVYGDITEKNSIKLNNIDVVFHLAGILGGWNIPEKKYWDVNLDGTRNMLDACLNKNIKQFVYLSTAGVLGPNVKNADESFPYNPSNIYEKTKAEAEKLVLEYNKKHGLPVTVLRPEFVYGPRDMHVLGLFRAIKKRRFFLIDGGKSFLHLTYISDLVRAFNGCINGNILGTYLIAGERAVTVEELVGTIAKELGVTLPKIYVPKNIANFIAKSSEIFSRLSGTQPLLTCSQVRFFTEDRSFDTSLAGRELGFKPIRLEEGIRKTVEWYKQNGLL